MKDAIGFAQFCSAGLCRPMLALCLIICTLGLRISASGQQLHFTTFSTKGAGKGAGQGTVAESVNIQGKIDGFYFDKNGISHGFVRAPDGEITAFDPPGAGPAGTLPFGSNPKGAIAGFYFDVNNVPHGFVRSPKGDITTFDAPGAVGTFAAQINPAGVIAGDYVDASNLSHGYLRNSEGDIISFDAPGAGTGAGQGTMTGFVDCINPQGAMTGYFVDANNVVHGYVRAPDGNIASFDAPGADLTAGNFNGTFPAGINLFGTIEGSYYDASNVSHGFVRTPNGEILTFDAPGADTIDSGYGTFPATLNDFGLITGSYLDASGGYHGFLRSPDGKFTTFDAPGADLTPGNFNGTFPSDTNLFGVITGFYTDAKNVGHAFVAFPCEHLCSDDDKVATAATVVGSTMSSSQARFPRALRPKRRLFPRMGN